MAHNKYNEKIGDLIKKTLIENGRSARWLADMIHCKRRNIYDIFNRSSFDTAQLLRISFALKTNFFVYYSENLIDKTEYASPTIFQYLLQDEIHIGKLIKNRLCENGQKASWLANKIRLRRDSVYKVFDRKSIDTALLLLVCETLKTNFFEYYCEIYDNTVKIKDKIEK